VFWNMDIVEVRTMSWNYFVSFIVALGLLRFGLCVDRTSVRDIYSERLLNLDTWIVQTLLLAPLVSVLSGSHCI